MFVGTYQMRCYSRDPNLVNCFQPTINHRIATSSIYFHQQIKCLICSRVTKFLLKSIFFPKDKEMTDILKVQFQLAVIRVCVGT